MLVSMIIVFRAAMGAGLIVGIVLAATEGVVARGRWIAGGIVTGVTGASLIAVFAAALSDTFQGTGQDVFMASILVFAVLMLNWHVAWMSRHRRAVAAELQPAGHAVRLGRHSLAALAVVVAIAVMREGSEVVLFLFGIAAGSHLATLSLAAGGVAGQAAAVLHGAELLPAGGRQVWDTSFILSDDSLAGGTLHALIGYASGPSGIQLAAWVATLLLLVVLSRLSGGRPRMRPVPAAAGLLSALLVGGTVARADDPLSVTFRNHRFEPARIEVPARTKFRLQVHNADSTADEFESSDLNREKLVPAGQSITVFLGPLDPGEYKFFGDFHQDTAQGVMVAK